MDQAIRNKLRGVVTQCRKLLEVSVSQELQGKFGIYVGQKDAVQVDDDARMTNLSADEHAARRDILDHFEHIKARGFKPKEALNQLIREIAYTHLNRFCAYKMMEARQVFVGGQRFREAVSRGVNSNGVKFYLADHPEEERLYNTGHQDLAYRRFLDWLGGLLSEEIGVLFNPNDSANRLYPTQKVLDEILTLLNDEMLGEIWTQDETVGWVYQYFTPKDLRDKARKEARAPQNSYELAYLNQFFTPRYVVEFLTDNTLGRIWYEMQRGDTKLKAQCRYLVHRPNEKFLDEGQERPNDISEKQGNLSQEGLLNIPVYVPYRPKKDPREFRILDPACGSGHFLLYCFDLLSTIYEEAYDDPDLGPALKKNYRTLADLKKSVPGLILTNNLHGIDIDLRATQIAALALWLRCQRAYQEIGLKADRPKITKSNIVCAEPMPGEQDLRTQFVANLEPKLLSQLVEVVFDKMRLAGEAGALLKIDEEIKDAVATARKQWLAGPVPIQKTLFGDDELVVRQQQFDFSGITDEQFFRQAEARVSEALREYAEQAHNGKRLQRRLFSDDTAQGFAFVDLCHQKFDVVLMNPPFGASSKGAEAYIESRYAQSKGDILAVFVERALSLCAPTGLVGVITSRTCFYLGTLTEFRENILNKVGFLTCMADLGEGVLEATVETAIYVLSRQAFHSPTVFVRCLLAENKAAHILHNLQLLASGHCGADLFLALTADFSALSGSPYCYWVGRATIRCIASHSLLEGNAGTVRVGLQTSDDFRFLRLVWEVPPHLITPSPSVTADLSNLDGLRKECLEELRAGKRWAFFSKTDEAMPWLSPLALVVDWENDGSRIKEYARQQGNSPSRSVRSEDKYFLPGVSYMLRSTRITPYIVPSGVIPTAGRAQVYPIGDEMELIGILSSNAASAIARFRGEKFAWPKFQASMIQELPVGKLQPTTIKAISSLVESHIDRSRRLFETFEPFMEFSVPNFGCRTQTLPHWDLFSFLGERLEGEVAQSLGLTESQVIELQRDIKDALDFRLRKGMQPSDEKEDEPDEDRATVATLTERDWAEECLSYAVGVVFGRWDVRFALDRSLIPKPRKAFQRMGACPTGMLLSPDGLPARPGKIVSGEWLEEKPDSVHIKHADENEAKITDDANYPVAIKWDGILVDDEGHSDDVVRGVLQIFDLIWKTHADSVEADICTQLAFKEFRDYFRKSGKGGFWDDHVSRHSMSRRKAPIYWLLQSAKKNYALWLYYHRLDKDLLFKALVNYIEPKIQRENNRLDEMRSQKEAAGASGKVAKKIDKDIERQEDLISELRDFEDKLRRVADLHLEPDLNDGVVLNIAPLHELVPWKEAKKYWEELLEGEYEWSAIGKQLQQKGMVK
jgi:hypothetical protein